MIPRPSDPRLRHAIVTIPLQTRHIFLDRIGGGWWVRGAPRGSAQAAMSLVCAPGWSGRSDAIRVEDRVDIAERGQEAAERLHVSDLGHVPVLRELVFYVAAVLDDVGAVLGEGTGHV